MKKVVLFFLITLIIPSFAAAQTSYLAGIDAALNIALMNSGELQATKAGFGVTEAKIFTANTRLNPVFVVDGGTAEKTYRIGVQLILETAGKRQKRTTTAQIQHDITQDEINVKVLDVKANVRKAYIELYAAQKKEESIKKLIETADNLLGVTTKKYKTADIPEIDIIQIEMIKINSQIDLQRIRSDIDQAHHALNLLLGHTLHNPCVLETPALEHNLKDIELLNEEQHNQNIKILEELAYENRPEFKLYQDNIRLAKSQIATEKANRIPNILVIAGPDLVVNKPGTLNVGAFLTGAVELPIFDRKEGTIKEAYASQSKAETLYKYQQDMVLYQIKDAYSRIRDYTVLINKYKEELLPRAENIVEDSIHSYDQDKDDIVVPMMAQEASMKVKFGYIQTMSDYQTAISDLERAIGTCL